MTTSMKSILPAVIVMLIGVSAGADTLVTTDSIDRYVQGSWSLSCKYTTMSGFTVDGNAMDNVYAIVLSEVDGEFILSGHGYSALGGEAFRFVMYGDSENQFVPASLIYFILNDDDPDLFTVNESTGTITLGLGEDIILTQEHLSIDGKTPGDISDIFYDYNNRGEHPLDSVALVTPAPPVEYALTVTSGTGMAVILKVSPLLSQLTLHPAGCSFINGRVTLPESPTRQMRTLLLRCQLLTP